jgi:hypothetical protein
MNDQPIYVTIKDERNLARGLSWLAKGAKWLAAGGTVTVDYDPWSCANRNQQACIAGAINNGSITMTINVLNDVGEYVSVPYRPGKAPKTAFIAPAQPVQAAKTAFVPQAKPAQVFEQTDTGSHTVVAGVNKVAAKYGIKSTVVTPPAGTADSYGFSTTDDVAPAEAASGFDKKAAIAAEQEDEQPEVVEPAEAQSDADKFNALLAEKKWSEAYRLVKAHFGDDKITFSQRSLQYIGSWEALVSKYGLDE